MLDGVNDSPEHAQALIELMRRHGALGLRNIIEIIRQAEIGQPHRIDAAQRRVAIARLGVAFARHECGGFGHKSGGSRLLHGVQLFGGVVVHAGGVHDAVVEIEAGDVGAGGYHGGALLKVNLWGNLTCGGRIFSDEAQSSEIS